MKTMTKEQLQAIRERAEKATQGPWESFQGLNGETGVRSIKGRPSIVPSRALLFGNDADFIAHARQDVPDLLAYIEQLEAMVDASGDYDMGAVCRNCGDTYGQHIGYECAKDGGGTFLPAPPAPTPNEKV